MSLIIFLNCVAMIYSLIGVIFEAAWSLVNNKRSPNIQNHGVTLSVTYCVYHWYFFSPLGGACG